MILFGETRHVGSSPVMVGNAKIFAPEDQTLIRCSDSVNDLNMRLVFLVVGIISIELNIWSLRYYGNWQKWYEWLT